MNINELKSELHELIKNLNQQSIHNLVKIEKFLSEVNTVQLRQPKITSAKSKKIMYRERNISFNTIKECIDKGMSFSETARHLGCSPANIIQRYKRYLRKNTL